MASRSSRERGGPLFGEVPDAGEGDLADARAMKKLIAVLSALCLLIVAAPASAMSPIPEEPEVKAAKAKKKKKKRPRYRISINYEGTHKDVSDCKSTTGDNYRIVNSTSVVTKFGETGYYPGGSRRTGYRETTIKTESTDPYVPSDEQKIRKDIQDVFGPDQWDFQINAKRTKFSYDWENAEGGIDDVVIRAPTKVGRSTKKELTGTWRSPDTVVENGERCTSWSERSVTETVTITRVQ
jgi:hypothetical protein